MRLRLLLISTLFILGVGCDEKKEAKAQNDSDAGVEFERIAPTPGDVTKANQNLRRIKKDVQKTSDDRGARIEERVKTE